MNIDLTGVEIRLSSDLAPLFRLSRLEIGSGSRVLIHGPSGRGKTTLLNLVSGQFPPHAGSIRVGETELTALDADARARFRRDHFGIIFQRWNLVDHLTVLENVMLGIPDPVARGLERKRRRAEESLRAAGIHDLAQRRAGVVSPGEQQRVAVARVRAAQPSIILADEPTSHLDDVGADRVLDALREASSGRTLIVVSHDPRARARFDDVRDFAALISPDEPAPRAAPADGVESTDERRA